MTDDLPTLHRKVRELRVAVLGLVVVLLAQQLNRYLSRPKPWIGIDVPSVNVHNWSSPSLGAGIVISGGTKETEPSIRLGEPGSKRAAITLGVREHSSGLGAVRLNGPDGRPRIELFVTPDGAGAVNLYDSTGKLVVSIPPAARLEGPLHYPGEPNSALQPTG